MKLGKLKVLMQEMADYTAPECASVCRVPHNCCDELACMITESYALEVYDIAIPRINQSGLLFMTSTGCSVEPYLRPNCTLHTCDINSLGFKKNDTTGWTEYYFELREKIDGLIYEMEEERSEHLPQTSTRSST